jgi:lysophospholipase L1-like esterase
MRQGRKESAKGRKQNNQFFFFHSCPPWRILAPLTLQLKTIHGVTTQIVECASVSPCLRGKLLRMTPSIFVVGDSISMHYGPYLEKYLANQIHYARKSGESEALLNLDLPMGANGGDSARVLDYLQGLLKTKGLQANALLINCGLHDIKVDAKTGRHQVTIDQYRSNLQQVIAVAKQLKTELVWITTTPSDDATHNTSRTDFFRYKKDNDAYREVAKEVMTAAGTPIIDLFDFTTKLGDNVYCDHVHFIEPVRQQQAAFIAGWVMGHFTK